MVELGKLQGYERSADVGKEKPDGRLVVRCRVLRCISLILVGLPRYARVAGLRL